MEIVLGNLLATLKLRQKGMRPACLAVQHHLRTESSQAPSDWLFSWKSSYFSLPHLPLLLQMISLNNVKVWDRRAMVRFSSSGDLQRGEVPAGCQHDSGSIHRDGMKAVQIESKWLD